MIRPESSPSSPVGKDTHETHPKIALSLIDPNPYRRFDINPLDTKKVEELRTSIQATGFWDNILVRALDGRYQLAYGHHRLEAARQELGSDTTVRAILREFTDEQMLRAMLDENRATVILTGRSIIEAVAAARLHFKTDENLRENISELLNYPKERVKDALSILYAIEEGKITKMVLTFKSLSSMTQFRQEVTNRPNATIERQEKVLGLPREEWKFDFVDHYEGYDSRPLGHTQRAIDDARKSRELSEKTGTTKSQRDAEAAAKEHEEYIARWKEQDRERKERQASPAPPIVTVEVSPDMEEARRAECARVEAQKAEKRERNQRRFEHVSKIIDAGVAALKQAGEFNNETQAALDWLRKVNAPPTPPKVVTEQVPEPKTEADEGSRTLLMKKYSQAREARRRAREIAGQPPKTRVIPDKRRKKPKHKKSEEES